MDIKVLLFLLLCLPSLGYSQYNSQFQQEYFFGNLPHARTEALARAGVSLGGSTAHLYYNPATLGLIEDWDATMSTSGPFYVLRESDYYFAGVSRRILPKWVLAASFHQLAIGPTTFDINFGNERYPVDRPTSSNLALSGAGEVLPGLYAGLNLNLFRWKYIEEISATYQAHVDAGLLYKLALPASATGKRDLHIGLSITNALNNSITYYGPQDETATSAFPTVLRLGATYIAHTKINLPNAGSGPLRWLITTEFQDVLNSEYRTAFKVGSEVLIWDVLALRLGLYTRNEDDLGNTVNKDRADDVTYGFGFHVPVAELTKQKLPVDLLIDYISLEPPPRRNVGGSRVPNFRTFTFGFQWDIE